MNKRGMELTMILIISIVSILILIISVIAVSVVVENGGENGGICGDGILNDGENCDGNSRSCTLSNGYMGTQECLSTCDGYNTCIAGSERCGDNVANGLEDCDGFDFGEYGVNSVSCNYYSSQYESGNLICKSDCTISLELCELSSSSSSNSNTNSNSNSNNNGGTDFSVRINEPDNGDVYGYKDDIDLNFTIEDDLNILENCWYQVDGGDNVSISSCDDTEFDVSGNGEHTITVYIDSGDGEEDDDSQTFFVNVGSPTIELLNNENGSFSNGFPVIFRYRPFDVNIDSCSLWGDFNGTYHENITNVNPNENEVNTFSLNLNNDIIDGYMWAISCYDGDATSVTGNRTIYIDNDNPWITISAPDENEIFNDVLNVNLEYEVIDNTNTRCEIKLKELGNGVIFSDNSENCEIESENLVVDIWKNYTVEITAWDNASNSNITYRNFSVESLLPQYCFFTDAYWNTSENVFEGDKVKAITESSTYCDGEKVNITFFDPANGIIEKYDNINFEGTTLEYEWETVQGGTAPSRRTSNRAIDGVIIPIIFDLGLIIGFFALARKRIKYHKRKGMHHAERKLMLAIGVIIIIILFTWTMILINTGDEPLLSAAMSGEAFFNITLSNNASESIVSQGGLFIEDRQEIECGFTSAIWNQTSANIGDKVKWILEGTDCHDETFNMTIYHSDGNMVNITKDIIFTGESTSKTWIVIGSDPPLSEYFNYEVILNEDHNEMIVSENLVIN